MTGASLWDGLLPGKALLWHSFPSKIIFTSSNNNNNNNKSFLRMIARLLRSLHGKLSLSRYLAKRSSSAHRQESRNRLYCPIALTLPLSIIHQYDTPLITRTRLICARWSIGTWLKTRTSSCYSSAWKANAISSFDSICRLFRILRPQGPSQSGQQFLTRYATWRHLHHCRTIPTCHFCKAFPATPTSLDSLPRQSRDSASRISRLQVLSKVSSQWCNKATSRRSEKLLVSRRKSSHSRRTKIPFPYLR
jgi:hypothetical protein